MSPRRLCGWEPAEYVEYVREAGVVVGHVVHREPEWSPADYDLLAAEDAWERSLDPNGIPMDEATDAQAGERDGAFFFRAGVRTVNPETKSVHYAPVTNYAEKARLDAEDAFKKDFPDSSMNGAYFHVEKVSRTPRAQ